MKSIDLKNGLSIIYYKDKYFVVNAFTKELMEAIDETTDINELCHRLSIEKNKLSRIYKTLQKEILGADYYEDNLSLEMPLKLQWRITPVCNLKCKHCYLGDMPNTPLTDEQLIRLAKKIAELGIMELTITGGEALTVRCLSDILIIITQRNIKVKVFTNGVLLKDLLKKIASVDKSRLVFSVSVDGMKEDHDQIRGNGSFDRTIEGIRAAKEKAFSIITNTVLFKENYKSVPLLFSFLTSLGVDEIQISNIVDSGRASSDMKLNESERDEFLNSLKSAIEKVPNGPELLYAHLTSDAINENNIKLIRKGREYNLGTEKWKCGAGVGRATIDYNGDIYCCPFLKKSRLGNILSDKFSDVWSNNNRFEFLKDLMSRAYSNGRKCAVICKRVD